MSIIEFEYKNIRKISSLKISFQDNEGKIIKNNFVMMANGTLAGLSLSRRKARPIRCVVTSFERSDANKNYPSDFKNAFKQFIKNKFDNNAKENDLKRVLSLLPDETEDDNNENVDY